MTDVVLGLTRLTVLRHGHAVDHCPSGDFDRALDERGEREIDRAALEIQALPLLPTLVIASPARRTRESAERLLRVWARQGNPATDHTLGNGVELRFESRLYLANVGTLQDLIALHEGVQPHLLIVGHNPGLSDLLHELNVLRALGTGDWHSLTR